MGALEFYNFYIGRKSPEDAFKELREEAAWESGRGGYSGTIYEKDSYVMMHCPKRKDPDKYADEIIDDNEKWGPAYCIEVKGAYLKKAKERFGYKGKRNIKAYIFCGWASY